MLSSTASTIVICFVMLLVGSYEPPPSLWLMEVMTQDGEEEVGGVSDILADALKESPCNERFYPGKCIIRSYLSIT
jgi:hypothetical protein